MIFVMQSTKNKWKVDESTNEKNGKRVVTISRNKISLNTNYAIDELDVDKIENLKDSTDFIKVCDSDSRLTYDKYTFDPVAIPTERGRRIFLLLTEDLTKFDTNTVVKVEYSKALVFDYTVHPSEITLSIGSVASGYVKLHIVDSEFKTRTVVTYKIVGRGDDVSVVRTVEEGLDVPNRRPFRNKYLTMRPYRPFTATSVIVTFDKHKEAIQRFDKSDHILLTSDSLESMEEEIVKLKEEGYTAITVYTDTARGKRLPDDEFQITRLAYKYMNLVHILHNDDEVQIQRLINYKNRK